jgi:hypothetical protein
MHRELDIKFAAVSERGFRTPVANIARVTALHYAQRAWIQLDQQNPASTLREEGWAKAEARLTVERQAAVLNLSTATTTTLAGVKPLVGGSSHLQGVTRDRPTIDLLQKTYASESMKAVMRGP